MYNRRQSMSLCYLGNQPMSSNGAKVLGCIRPLATLWLNSMWLPCNMHNIKTLRLRQNGHHFADDIMRYIFFNENVWILIKISMKFVPECSVTNIPALVQIMVWHRLGDKSLSEPMVFSLLTHLWVILHQWVKNIQCLTALTHRGQVTHIFISKLNHHWFR